MSNKMSQLNRYCRWLCRLFCRIARELNISLYLINWINCSTHNIPCNILIFRFISLDIFKRIVIRIPTPKYLIYVVILPGPQSISLALTVPPVPQMAKIKAVMTCTGMTFPPTPPIPQINNCMNSPSLSPGMMASVTSLTTGLRLFTTGTNMLDRNIKGNNPKVPYPESRFRYVDSYFDPETVPTLGRRRRSVRRITVFTKVYTPQGTHSLISFYKKPGRFVLDYAVGRPLWKYLSDTPNPIPRLKRPTGLVLRMLKTGSNDHCGQPKYAIYKGTVSYAKLFNGKYNYPKFYFKVQRTK